MIRMATGPMPASHNGLVLVQVRRILPNKQTMETAWAKPLGGDLYEIKGPLHLITSLNTDDIVKALILPGEAMPSVLAVVKRSGFKTLHLVFSKAVPVLDHQNILKPLTQWGVTYTSPLERFHTLEVNPRGDYQEACDYLKSLKLQGLIMYEPDVNIRTLLRFRRGII
jgi:uncharacterized protein DUF4265